MKTPSIHPRPEPLLKTWRHLHVRRALTFGWCLMALATLAVPAAHAGAIKYFLTPGDMNWPDGRVPYVFKSEINSERAEVFRLSARAWQRVGNIKFIPTTQILHISPEGHFVEIQNNDLYWKDKIEDVNYAFIGRCGIVGSGMQPMSIHNWNTKIVVHELGHVLGFVHEQARQDRDDHITINWPIINGWTTINFNKEWSTWHSPYDFQSVMHYSNDAFRDTWQTGNAMEVKPPYSPDITYKMGRNWENFPKNLPNRADFKGPDSDVHGTSDKIGYLVAGLSNGDRQTVVDIYGQPTTIYGVVALANGFKLEGVKVELIGQGPDEVHFVDLINNTAENGIITKKDDGKYTFLGVPHGIYKVRASKPGHVFLQNDFIINTATSTVFQTDFTVTSTGDTTPPTITIETPPQRGDPAKGGENHYKGSSGSYPDYLGFLGILMTDPGGLGVQTLQVAMTTGGGWWNWTGGPGGTGVLDPPSTPFDENVHVKSLSHADNSPMTSFFMGPLSGWPSALPEGKYDIQFRARDLSNNWSLWNTKQTSFTIDASPPSITTAPPAGGAPVHYMGIKEIGGPVSDVGDAKPEVTFVIKEDNGLSAARYWTPVGDVTNPSVHWTANANDPNIHLLGVIGEDGNWHPASESLLPTRADLREGPFVMKASAKDKAGNPINAPDVTFVRSPLDTTLPELAITEPAVEARYTEHVIPAINGTASDPQSGIQGVQLYLMRYMPGGGYKWWSGDVWSDTEGHFEVAYDENTHTWTAPALDYRLPSGSDLPDGTYHLAAFAFNREAPQGTRGVENTFRIASNPPTVAVTSLTHNGWAKMGWGISGTVTDPAGVGFAQGNRVTLSINREGQYWDGDSWTTDPTTLYADILPNYTWTYPGTTPGATMPTGDGSYTLSVHARDNNIITTEIVAGGLPGNNQIVFTVDATPPLLALSSPEPGAVVDASPIPAGFINGTSSDSSGAVTVTFRLKRLPSVLSTDVFWNEETWKDAADATVGELDLDGTFPGDGGPTSWKFTGVSPTLGWDFSHCMINGDYEVVAIAKDLAGNETTLTRPFVVDYHPQYIPPAFENMPLHPLQAPPIAAGSVASTEVARFVARADAEDTRVTVPLKFAIGTGGTLFAASYLASASPSLSGYAVQRLGASPWRSERVRSFFQSGNEYTFYESWFPTGSSFQIPSWRYSPTPASIEALETDAAGNVYALFRQQIQANPSVTSQHALLVKYNASGSVAWVRTVPDVETHNSFFGTPTLVKMAWLADGSLGLLFRYAGSYPGSGSSVETVMTVFETDGDMRFLRPFGVTDITNPAPTDFASSPVDFAGDAAGNVFIASNETGRFTGQASGGHRIIRKLSPLGVTLATHITDTCDFPENWHKLATDPAGNVYVGGIFIGGIRTPTDPARQEMIKFDNNLVFQWRAFGPGRNPEMGDMLHGMDAAADGVMTVDKSGMAAFFTSAGALQWARPIITGITAGGNYFTFGGGACIGIAYTGHPDLTQHLVKMSRAGDVQFDIAFTENTDQIRDLRATASHIHLLRNSSGTGGEGYITQFDNPADVTIPVTLDPVLPRDQILITGDALEMKVINTGTLATGHQWRKYDNGTPVNIPGATSDTFTINSVVLGDAGLYDCVVTNPNNNATSRTASLAVLPPAAFDVALDTPGRTWTTGGNAPFVGFMAQNPAGPAHDNVDAVMNRPIGPNQTSFIETTFTGAGSVTFWWKSSNEQFMDTFTLSIDGGELDYLTGEQDWTQVSENFGPGTHTLRWTYNKVGNSTSTQDRVWLDEVSFVADTITQTFSQWLGASGFTPAQLADQAITGPDADPDHDGIANLLEFAMAADPTSNSVAPTPVNVPGTGFMEFIYTRNKRAMSDLTFQVQWTDDLAGVWSAVGVTESILSDSGFIQQVKALVPTDGKDSRFVNLKVTRP